tara:strand:- start:11746 stop:12507 length:762 start_codon:yes stop_codon:yes gene_type:complete
MAKKYVLITGGAGKLGTDICKVFNKNKINLIILDNDEKKLKILKNKLSGDNFYCSLDIANQKELINFCKTNLKKYLKNNHLLGLIHNARPYLSLNSVEKSFDEWDLASSVILKSAAILAHYSLSFLKKSKGNIVNIGSTNSSFISEQPIVYTVFKSALVHLTSWQAVYYGHMNIKSNLISPCLISSKKESKKEKKINSKSIPLKKKTNISEISLSIFNLITNKFPNLTGNNIVIDGGMTLIDHNYLIKRLDEK